MPSFLMLMVIVPSVAIESIMLIVIILNVVAPFFEIVVGTQSYATFKAYFTTKCTTSLRKFA
jgi:hypothetical protein